MSWCYKPTQTFAPRHDFPRSSAALFAHRGGAFKRKTRESLSAPAAQLRYPTPPPKAPKWCQKCSLRPTPSIGLPQTARNTGVNLTSLLVQVLSWPPSGKSSSSFLISLTWAGASWHPTPHNRRHPQNSNIFCTTGKFHGIWSWPEFAILEAADVLDLGPAD
jgi:hypothetical protein